MRKLAIIEDFLKIPETFQPPYGLPTLDKKSKTEHPFPEMTDKHLDDVKWLGAHTTIVKKCAPEDKD